MVSKYGWFIKKSKTISLRSDVAHAIACPQQSYKLVFDCDKECHCFLGFFVGVKTKR